MAQFRGDVTTFLIDATTIVFKVDFLSLDMIDLVTQPNALSLLRSAETQADQGDHIEALALLAEAFEYLLKDYADRKQHADHSSLYTLWKQGTRSMFGQNHDRELTKRLAEAEAGLERFRRAFRVLAMGVNYERYARFELLVPSVAYFMDGHREVRSFPGLDVGNPEYQFCKQFVIETALHLAELDFDLNLYEVYWEHQKSQQAAATSQASGAP